AADPPGTQPRATPLGAGDRFGSGRAAAAGPELAAGLAPPGGAPGADHRLLCRRVHRLYAAGNPGLVRVRKGEGGSRQSRMALVKTASHPAPVFRSVIRVLPSTRSRHWPLGLSQRPVSLRAR